MKQIVLFVLLAFAVVSCIPEDTPVDPYIPGNLAEVRVGMGPFYKSQVYVSLDLGDTLKSNYITDWDLSFSCKADKFFILLNTSKFMTAYNLGKVDFTTVSQQAADTIPTEAWMYDNPNGNLDSTAIGKWWNDDFSSIGNVYLIYRGTDEKAKKQGYAKFRIVKFENNTYFVEFANLKDNIVRSVAVPKNSLYNYVHLSFSGEGKVLELEPPKTEWDLLFTKYTELLYTNTGEGMWYSVTGAYLNTEYVSAAQVYAEDFDSIDERIVDTLNFSNRINIIGHEWKDFDLNSNYYVVYPKRVYIIKTVKGNYFKMHFIDFYDDGGNKGYPLMEYKRL